MAWTRYTLKDRERIAAEYDQWADNQQATADRLADEGHHTAAGIHRRGAQASREVADAARESSDALNYIVNG